MEKEKNMADSLKLRRLAEERLTDTAEDSDDLSGKSQEDIASLVHELRVHQIELEMQNEELRRIYAELERTKDRYSHLYDFSPVGYLSISEKGMIEEANLTVASMLGVERGVLIKKPFTHFVLKDDQDIYYQHRQRLMETEETRICELRLVKKDAHVFYARLECMVNNNKDDDVKQIRATVSDIAELKRMEEEILKAEKLESLGVLAGGLAHDFNNVLTTILGNVSMAKYQASPESDIFELLSEVEAASKRAQSLTNQLLTFAKGGAPVKETASLADIIKESSGFVMSGSKSVCELSIADNLWPVEVDVGQISQVIHNIIINANQAMPEGGVIKIRAGNLIIDEGNERQLKPGRYVRMSFNDEGMGISEKHLSKIFDPYFTTKHAGSGLGLAATYSIIRRHGGIITVETQMEIGTTFHICLPASEKPVPDKERAELLTGKGKILVMDDEAPLRKMYGMVLGKLGYTSEFAEDGDEALRMAKEAKQASKPYDAAILDLTIPGGMGGKEAIQKLLEIDPEIRAIVSSGYADDPVMADFQEYGFKGRLAKPFEFGALSNVLHEVIKGE